MTVNRFHAHPNDRLRNSGDTIKRHQNRVALLCLRICSAIDARLSPDLSRAAKNHDAAEQVIGDMPGPAKERFPALAAAYAKAELEVLAEMGLTWTLTRQEADILALADKLDAWLWASRHGVRLIEDEPKMRAIADRLGASEWLASQLATG